MSELQFVTLNSAINNEKTNANYYTKYCIENLNLNAFFGQFGTCKHLICVECKTYGPQLAVMWTTSRFPSLDLVQNLYLYNIRKWRLLNYQC